MDDAKREVGIDQHKRERSVGELSESEMPEQSAPDGSANAVAAPPMEFYRLQSSRITLREHLNNGIAMLPGFLIHKLFFIPIPTSSDDPCVESIRPFEVSGTSMDPKVSAGVAPIVAELIA